MSDIQILIDKIKSTDYESISNGKALKEIDFEELSNACEEIERELIN